MEVGEELTFYPISFRESEQYPGTFSILAQDEEGGRFYISTAGNVKYLIADGKVGLGLLTKITRQEDRKMKKSGKMTSNFEVLQDPDTVLVSSGASASSSNSDAGFDAITSTTSEKAHADSTREAVKKHAAKLAAGIKK